MFDTRSAAFYHISPANVWSNYSWHLTVSMPVQALSLTLTFIGSDKKRGLVPSTHYKHHFKGISSGRSVYFGPYHLSSAQSLPHVQTQIIIHRSTRAELSESLPAGIYCSLWLQKQRCMKMKGVKEKKYVTVEGLSRFYVNDQIDSGNYHLYYIVLYTIIILLLYLVCSVLSYYITFCVIFGLQDLFRFFLCFFSNFPTMPSVLKQKRTHML